MIQQPPEGLIITISKGMLKEKGYRNWLRNFFEAMDRWDVEWTYWMRLGTVPKHEIQYIYLCIGGKIRYRCYFGGYQGACEKEFSDGKKMFARAWVILSGPLERPVLPIEMKGFRGFRYTEKLF